MNDKLAPASIDDDDESVFARTDKSLVDVVFCKSGVDEFFRPPNFKHKLSSQNTIEIVANNRSDSKRTCFFLKLSHMSEGLETETYKLCITLGISFFN